GKTIYDMAPLCFAKHTESFVSLGVSIFGGCCGTSFGHIETLSRVVRSLESKIFMPSPEEDEIIATSETDIHVLDVTYDIGEEVVCGPDLAEDILDRNDEDYRIIKIRIEDEDELEIFLENQYLMKLPVCIVSESPEIMEKAVRRYNGRAVFDNSSDLPSELIEKLSQSYGLIKL
ncbi:MAG: hypothetical protein GX633_10735, partial [Clostridiales bacterium]|nr:hypothetical protein [Clostridiales bacterium]